ncbi:MAG: flagellar hook-length control protein FliK, partial [Pseudomonadota bacterium]
LLARNVDSSGRALSVTLYPEELGRLDVRVASTGEQAVAVSVAATQPQVRELLEAHVARLRQALAETGFDQIAFDFESSGEHQRREQESSSSAAAQPIDALEPSAVNRGNDIALRSAAQSDNATATAPSGRGGFDAYA